MDSISQITSPKGSDGASNSKFKTLKKKIRNKFRLSRPDGIKTIAQAVEILRKSDEILTLHIENNSEIMENEFKGSYLRLHNNKD